MRWRLSRGLSAFGAAALSLMTGCAIHPLPEDVAPLNTVEIVEHIRCEMYQALRHQVVLAFQLSDNGPAHAVAREIEAHPERSLQDFQGQINLLKPVYQRRVKAFKAVTIGYGYRFNITEQDIARSELNFGLPWNPASSFNLRAGGGLDKTRSNTRRFFKIDTFEELLTSTDCLAKPLRDPNIVYPITGEIGLTTTVSDFIKLSTRGARNDPDARDVNNFSEQLTFTTEISGTIAPTVRLSPMTDAFKLASANGELTARRRDVHELTVTFGLGKAFATEIAGAPTRRDAVIQELNTLRFLDAVERSGNGAGVVVAP